MSMSRFVRQTFEHKHKHKGAPNARASGSELQDLPLISPFIFENLFCWGSLAWDSSHLTHEAHILPAVHSVQGGCRICRRDSWDKLGCQELPGAVQRNLQGLWKREEWKQEAYMLEQQNAWCTQVNRWPGLVILRIFWPWLRLYTKYTSRDPVNRPIRAMRLVLVCSRSHNERRLY